MAIAGVESPSGSAMIENVTVSSCHRKRGAGRIPMEMREFPSFSSAPNSVRFVVLAHDEPNGGRHFDLMIAQGPALATWRCPVEPEKASVGPLTLKKLPDHRLHYLTYEGPISGNRGMVRRRDEGTCAILRREEAEWLVEFSGRVLNGRFQLRSTSDADQSWLLLSLEK